MKPCNFIPLVVLLFFISSCASSPTPYVSNIDPCASDTLTLVASTGGVPRCDKVPTVTPRPAGAGVSKTETIKIFLNMIIEDSQYDSSKRILHKYVDALDIELKGSILVYTLQDKTAKPFDVNLLSGELFYASAFVSHAGDPSEWLLTKIELNWTDVDGNKTTYFVSGHNDIVGIAKGNVALEDVIQSRANPVPTEVMVKLLCKDALNLIGIKVECKIPVAYCSYQPATAGSPTFCNDAPYPNHNFALVVWDSDWSDLDGHCIIVSGNLKLFSGKPQIEATDRSQISYCD